MNPQPQSMGVHWKSFIAGLVLGGLVVVWWGSDSFFGVIKSKDTHALNTIINNLRIIEGAKDQWALDAKKSPGDDPGTLSTLSDYFKGRTISTAVNEIYTPEKIGTPAYATLPATVKLGTYTAGSKIIAP